MIVPVGSKFELRSRATGRVLGTHPSYEAALRQERAIQASKARRNPCYGNPAMNYAVRVNPFIQPADRKKVLMALFKRFKSMGDGRVVAGKHLVMLATEGYKTVTLEDLSDDEIIRLAHKHRILHSAAAERSNPTMRRTYGVYQEITSADVGKKRVRAFGSLWPVEDFIGYIGPRDVGKRMYKVGGIIQVENDSQRSRRVARMNPSGALHEVIVGNVGTVYSGHDGHKANVAYATYLRLSKSGVGRAADEPVYHMVDGDIRHEHQPESSRSNPIRTHEGRVLKVEGHSVAQARKLMVARKEAYAHDDNPPARRGTLSYQSASYILAHGARRGGGAASPRRGGGSADIWQYMNDMFGGR